ncbi:MAG TPA: patatin-like phospholipase family protein [Acetobacteraceae bacterium]
MADSDILGTHTVLCDELDTIERRRQRRGCGTDGCAHSDLETHGERTRHMRLSALCLSGGGIRSAAFCLGALQALAAKRMLRQFDFLSTVSGGGFIGGWLQVLIREAGGVASAEDTLALPRSEPLRRLRAYTNYLTPQTGPLSTDTWAGIVLYLRNLLINWTVFVPLFMLIALIPITYRTAISACSNIAWLNLVLLGCAGLALLYGVISVCSLLPSHRKPRAKGGATPAYASDRNIRWDVVYPALGWTLLVPWLLDFATAHVADAASARPWLAHHAFWIVPTIYFVLMTSAYCLAWGLQWFRSNPGVSLFRANIGRWIAASFGAALLTWLMLVIAGAVLPLEVPAIQIGGEQSPIRVPVDTAAVLTVFAPLALAVVHVLQTALYVALRRENELADLDREWLGRVNAMILRLAVGWTVFALCCLILPLMIQLVQRSDGSDLWSGGRISVVGALSVLIGGAAAWLGKIWPSVESFVEKPGVMDRVRAHLPTALGAVFAIGLLVVFGGVLSLVLGHLQDQITWVARTIGNDVTGWAWLPLILQAAVALILFIGVMRFRNVNVNRFSMHAIYRNRLTRAFLGSARNKRDQDPFTGFDPWDNLPLSSLLDVSSSLFPVINMTLNITAGTNTAWAERQAASFTATPLVCGSGALRHPSQAPTAVDPDGAFVPTTRFAGLETLTEHPTKPTESGAGLGSALTVSGAAVSPSWGYHSSRITAFLMTLFNVRLGIWLPNPSKATADELRLARPRNSLMALIDEMLGETTDDSQAIYLSDGGHFENLGLYEMFRRRCSSILVIDAGSDEACAMTDLGNAIRKAEIDFGVSVEMQEPMHVYPRTSLEDKSDLSSTALGFAYGKIKYDGGHSGELLYIKPSFLAGIPADVRSYGAEHKAFPHESTLDQWFTESQFESYRMLGRYQMAELVGDDAKPAELATMFETARVAGLPSQKPPADAAGCDGIRVLASVIAGRIGPSRGVAETAAAAE